MVHIPVQTRIKRVTEGVIYRALGAEIILIVLESRASYALNPVGTTIWNLADGQKTVAEIASALGEIYDVVPDVALQDTLELVAGLMERGLMTVVADSSLQTGSVIGNAPSVPVEEG